MTRETYMKHTTEYVGKHAPRYYNVWRVRRPYGPAEELLAYGIHEAQASILGCWEWEVTDTNGNKVDPRIILYSR